MSNPVSYPCTVETCTKKYSSDDALRKHISVKHEDAVIASKAARKAKATVPCPYCETTFVYSYNMSQHIKDKRGKGDIQHLPREDVIDPIFK
jgi:hypothetical protein